MRPSLKTEEGHEPRNAGGLWTMTENGFSPRGSEATSLPDTLTQ